MDRAEFAAALRDWRERLAPSDVGLPAGSRRRTPGLRREELAGLAGISVDYLTRLEQGRGAHPSDAVVGALARALRLHDAERHHLFHLAGMDPPRPGHIDGVVRPSVLRLMDRFADLPVVVVSAKLDYLAWNPMAAALFGDLSATPPAERNVVWQRFVSGDSRLVGDEAELARLGLALVADLRDTAARYPRDPGLDRLLRALRRRSPEFARVWDQRPIAARHNDRKTLRHPEVGDIELDCDVLRLPSGDQTMLVYSAAEDTPAAAALALLRVVGTQSMTPSR